ncbi:MAG: hypothetical protein Q9218_003985 [Villophora microphyllina]
MKDLVATATEKQLQEAGYLGDYHLGPDGFCYRVEVAVRTQTMTKRKWDKFVAGFGVEDPTLETTTMTFIADHLVEPFRIEVEDAISSLQASAEPQGACRLLMERWKQIRVLLLLAAESHEARNDR